MEKDAIIKLESGGLALRTLEEMYRYGQYVVAAGMAPATLNTPEKIIVALQTGAELGLGYQSSLRSIFVVNGNPTIYGDAGLALVRRSGLLDTIIEKIVGDIGDDLSKTKSDVRAVCSVKRKGCELAHYDFSVREAKLAGLWMKKTKNGGNTPWCTHPQRMLMYKARSFALRDQFPDVLLGLHFKEEMEHVEPIYVESTVVEDEMGSKEITMGPVEGIVPGSVRINGEKPSESTRIDDPPPETNSTQESEKTEPAEASEPEQPQKPSWL